MKIGINNLAVIEAHFIEANFVTNLKKLWNFYKINFI